ncbi:MAG: OAM dimerization domain-containing protein [Thermodesulfobacteriota bacterium]|nr:OAM dimerization domain-containing protein [Thermodesulfobacteriota bacterium]
MKENVIKPYGYAMNDGVMQLSFTLPVENGSKAKKAAELYVSRLNMDKVSVVHSSKISDDFTFFVVYARALPTIDYATVVSDEIQIEEMGFYEINELIKKKLNRPLTVVGAAIGSDAHTVGIDAIMNMKGYNQDYGLERYPQINTCNMGAQVPPSSLIQKAVEIQADAILISQTVTQRDTHIRNLKELLENLNSAGLGERFILIVGGPGITNDFAVGLGFHAGFGRGTRPSQVASFLVMKMLEKGEKK